MSTTAASRWVPVCSAAICAALALLTAAWLAHAVEQWWGQRERALDDIERYERDTDYPNRESNLASARAQLAAVNDGALLQLGLPGAALAVEFLLLVPLWRAAARRISHWRLALIAAVVTIAIAGALTLLLLYAMRGVITG